MKIKTIKIRNFLAISEAKVELADRGLILIRGDNKVDTSADSNGTGKSSIPDALCWALYGKTARGVTGDAVVSRGKKNCGVRVAVEDGGNIYYISRFRKDTAYKNKLMLETMDANGNPVDLTGGTDKLTQEKVNGIIGCSHDVFVSAIYAGQEMMPDLPSMTDKQLKEIIEEAADIKTLNVAYARAKAEVRELASAAMLAHNKMAGAENALMDRQESLAGVKKQADGYNATRDAAVEELNNRLQAVEDALLTVESGVELKKRLDTRRGELNRIMDAMSTADADYRKKRDIINDKVMSARLAHDRVRNDLKNSMLAHKKIENEIDQVSHLAGKKCGECGRPYTEHEIDPAKEILAEKLEQEKAIIRELRDRSQDAARLSELASQELAALDNAPSPVSKIARLYRDTESDVKAIESELKKRDSLEREKSSFEAEIEKTKNAPNPFLGMLKRDLEKVDEAVEQLKRRKEQDVAAIRKLKIAEAVRDVFGPSGVRAHILDTVTPFLNDRTNHYLATLSDGEISAGWSTISVNKSGAAREKFNIEVSSVNGANSFAGLSGGEKRKVRLATALALQDLVASRASKPIQLWIGDEIDDALDESGLERLMGLLENRARERGSVFVISHNELTDWIRDSITVEKLPGGAVIAK